MPSATRPRPGALEPSLSAAELRCVSEFLGLHQRALARILGVNERTVARWVEGATPVPVDVAAELDSIGEATMRMVEEYIDSLRDTDEPVLMTYRRDADLWADRDDLFNLYPATWHRSVAARVAQEIPGLRIVFGPVA